MMELGNPSSTIEVIKKHGFNFQKKFGQNFLVDTHVLNKIIDSADISKNDCVIEIGPGIGTMTRRLADKAGRVIAVEIDKNLIPILEDTLRDFDNIIIINEDILKVDINKLVKEFNDNRPVKIVANLPYYITTPIIMGLLEGEAAIESITVMVQKEVAERMNEKAGTKDYGALSLAVQYYADTYLVANVPPHCFIPRPNVASAVIKLTKHANPLVKVKDEAMMFKLIRASFNQRRKTLVNGLKNSKELDFKKELIEEALKSIGKDINIRGETLSLDEFAQLSDFLSDNVYVNSKHA